MARSALDDETRPTSHRARAARGVRQREGLYELPSRLGVERRRKTQLRGMTARNGCARAGRARPREGQNGQDDERDDAAHGHDEPSAEMSYTFASSQSGRCEIDETIPSGRTLPRSTVSGRNLPVRTRTVFIPCACAPAMSASMSSPTIHVMLASASSASSAASKYAVDGLPSTIASVSAAYSSPATNAPASSSGPFFVCHHRFLCRQ